jgi:HEAT repeat protein
VVLIGPEIKHLDKLFAGAEVIFRATKSEGDRDIAVSGFGEAIAAAGEEGVDRVIRGLGDEREGARRASMWALYFLGPKGAKAVPVVIRKLNEGDTRAIDVLGAIGPKAKDAVPHLIRRLEKDEWAHPRSGRSLIHHSASAQALTAIGPAAIPALVDGLKHKNELVVVGCMIALAKMGAKAKVPPAPLVPHTRHDNAIIRYHAMLALVKHGLPKDDLTPILARLQKDSHPVVAFTARKELERLRP